MKSCVGPDDRGLRARFSHVTHMLRRSKLHLPLPCGGVHDELSCPLSPRCCAEKRTGLVRESRRMARPATPKGRGAPPNVTSSWVRTADPTFVPLTL